MARPPGEPGDDHLIVARIRRSHGVKGEVQVAVDTDRPKQVFRRGRELYLGDATGRSTGETVVLEGVRPTTGGVILKLRGVEHRDAADTLRGRVLMIPADQAQPAAGDEVHYRHLVGLTAVDHGYRIGEVEDILELPNSELLVVRASSGKEVLIPFVQDLVRGVDLEAGELRLELPEGFLEI